MVAPQGRSRSGAPPGAPAPPVGSTAPVPAGEPTEPPAERPPLPAVESLTPESDFTPFMSPEVDGGVRRQALKTLFSDPRYNVMDMMDVYVDDYSKPDPIPESWMGKLEQLSRLGDRAGRDREEAERQRALAQEVAEAGQEQAAAAGTEAGNRGEAPAALAGVSPVSPESPAGLGPAESSDRNEVTIPPNSVGGIRLLSAIPAPARCCTLTQASSKYQEGEFAAFQAATLSLRLTTIERSSGEVTRRASNSSP